ncbi:RNA-directed DNA polymerase from mobile element jockey [Trichonephila clavipes]|nr:RNA-directed DNA polymerase from mobile element jockey [Trichonephila clavipes]
MGNVLESAALCSYRHTKGIRRGKGPLTNATVARMISKFEATGCLDDRHRSVRPSTRWNAAETVKDEMETVGGSSMHREVSGRAVAPAFHTLLFRWHLGVPFDAIRTKFIGIMNCYLAIP